MLRCTKDAVLLAGVRDKQEKGVAALPHCPLVRWTQDYLERLTGKPPLDELVTQLKGVTISLQDVAQLEQSLGIVDPYSAKRPSDEGYDEDIQRHWVHKGTWYEVILLCWKAGQRSSIHDHTGSTCAVAVVDGEATEQLFDRMSEDTALPLGTPLIRRPGHVFGSEGDDIHQVCNRQAEAGLKTIHVYTPVLTGMRRYKMPSYG